MDGSAKSHFFNRTLILLTLLNYLNYIDRYILAAVLSSIKIDLSLTDFQAGLLATAFMIPYMFTAPLFGWLGDTQNRSKILAFGGWVWSVATLFSGMAQKFYTMMFSRFMLGFGESAFTTISVPFLADHFPISKKGKAIAIFSSALPVGAALGYLLGGLIGGIWGWRSAFLVVGAPGVIISFFIFKLKDPRHQIAETKKYIANEVFKILTKNRPYILGVLGYCAYTFVVGGIAHWIPTFIQRTHHLTEMQSNTLFGGIAVVSGFSGTLLGGYWGDLFHSKNKHNGHYFISALSMFLSLPFFVICILTSDIMIFAFTLFLTQFMFFLSTSPINVALLESIPGEFRTSAMAIAIFMIHLLGDGLSAPLIGKVSDITGNLQWGVLLCIPVILLATFFWWLAMKKPKHALEHVLD